VTGPRGTISWAQMQVSDASTLDRDDCASRPTWPNTPRSQLTVRSTSLGDSTLEADTETQRSSHLNS